MQNFMKTILSAVQTWTKGKIKESTADWNQNDSSADSYVKNRTHWEEGKKVVLVDNLTYENYNNEDYHKCTFVIGKKYDVIWNGTLYNDLVCHYEDEWRVIASNGNGCPFYIDDDGGDALYIEGEDDDNWTVSIIESNTVVHKLDSKYLSLPTNLATTDDVQEAMDVANTAVANAATAQTTADSKMDKTNPVCTGSFSMNRTSGTTVGDYSVAIGYYTTASGNHSHAEGYYTTASGSYSHAEGCQTKATFKSSDTVSKTSNSATGVYTHAEGYGTVAYGRCSHAEGNGTKASGSDSHAEGRSTIASGAYSHAEGYSTIASGDGSHAEGFYTTASGSDSHAEGHQTKATAAYTHAEGYITTAQRKYQHVQGKYNILDTTGDNTSSIGAYAHIVGNGASDTTRSNAHTLDWDGNAWYQGDVYVGSTSGTNKDDGSKKLATEEYVDTNAIPSPSTAQVGQILSVKAVDENGKPTEWEAVDMPSGSATSTNGLELVDKTTGTHYNVYIDNGQLTMEVV